MTVHKIKHISLQLARRLVQAGMLFVLAGVVFVSLYAHYRAARALEDEQLMAGWKGAVLNRINHHVDGMENPQSFLDGYKGTIWSMQLAGIDLSDPLAAAELIATSKTLYSRMLLSIVIPVVVTLLLGKIFCSWICPANVLFELTGKLRKLLRLAELPPPEVEFSRRNKYILLVVGLILAAALSQPIFALVYPPAVVSRIVHAWIFGTALTGMLVLLALIITFEVLVSPRWWCRCLCPGGALYGLLGWPRLLRVKLDSSKCTNCQACEPVCEPGLKPIIESYNMECDNCGQCVRYCPEQALYYTIGLPLRRKTQQNDESSPSKKLALFALLITTLALWPHQAQAHHILGLPHYSYKENYPQVPTLEYPATTGPYDVLLTCYPGKPVPKEPVNLAFYIKNRNTGVPYDKPITVRVLQTFTFGRNREVLPPTVVEPFEQPHKLSVTFPEDGEYITELSIQVEGQLEVIPFMMIAGEPSATTSVVVAVISGLAIFVIVIRAIKIKRDRRAKLLQINGVE